MPVYKYKAINDKSKVIRGFLSAKNPIDLREKLNSMNYTLVQASIKREFGFAFTRGFSHRDIIDIFIHLEKTMQLQIPLLECLNNVLDSISSVKLRSIVSEMKSAVSSGKMLNEAMAMHPEAFSKLMVDVVGAGERNGNIVDTLGHLTRYMQWQLDVKGKMLSATYYPIGLLCMVLVALVFMFVKVLPKIMEFLLEQGVEIPIYTRALIATAHFVSHQWYYIIIAIVVIFIIKFLIFKFVPNADYYWDAIKLKMPIVSNIVLKINIASFAYLFAMSLKSGVGIIGACDVGGGAVGNLVIKEFISNIKKSVTNGSELSTAMEVVGCFPELVIKLAKIGQSTGTLPEMMERVAGFYDMEAKNAVDFLAGTIKPFMILLVGMLLIWIVMGTFGPMYQNVGNMVKNYQ